MPNPPKDREMVALISAWEGNGYQKQASSPSMHFPLSGSFKRTGTSSKKHSFVLTKRVIKNKYTSISQFVIHDGQRIYWEWLS